jgi:uncharacterized membrane protein
LLFRTALLYPIAVILTQIILIILLHPSLPEQMVVHWNAAGEPDGYMPKWPALLLLPIISMFLLCIFLLIPKIDPMKQNIRRFIKFYDVFVLLFFSFMLYLFILLLLWNLGHTFSMLHALLPAFAVLLYGAGVLCDHAKQNWFIGVRTPWTLSSKRVWEKTHKLAAKLFKISAVVTLLGLIWPHFALLFLLVPLFASLMFLVYYSYREYEIEKRAKHVRLRP